MSNLVERIVIDDPGSSAPMTDAERLRSLQWFQNAMPQRLLDASSLSPNLPNWTYTDQHTMVMLEAEPPEDDIMTAVRAVARGA